MGLYLLKLRNCRLGLIVIFIWVYCVDWEGFSEVCYLGFLIWVVIC